MASTQTEEHTAWNTLIADAANDKASAFGHPNRSSRERTSNRVTDLVTAEQNARPALEQDEQTALEGLSTQVTDNLTRIRITFQDQETADRVTNLLRQQKTPRGIPSSLMLPTTKPKLKTNKQIGNASKEKLSRLIWPPKPKTETLSKGKPSTINKPLLQTNKQNELP